MNLYRQVGFKELQLIAETGFKRFPRRLSTQPTFYPILTYEYAERIARHWNTKDLTSGYAGFVLSFEVDDLYIKKFPIHRVGNHHHQEFWISAEEMGSEFNQHIFGKISVDASFYGADYRGE